MTSDQFHKGLGNIRAELLTALRERGVTDASVTGDEHVVEPQATAFGVTVAGKTQTDTFTREEIEDSGEAIDAPVAVKVRMLVSHFVR